MGDIRVPNKKPVQKSGPGFFVNCSSDLSGLQLRFATQFTAGVAATRAFAVVRLRDLAVVLGHVISSI